MERHDPSPADGRLALAHGAPVARRGPDVVAGREQMAGIQADADPLGPSRALDERGQLAERAADRVAGAGGVLERDLDAIARVSSGVSGFAAHCRWFFRKIWTAPQPSSRPRSRARCSPPAMDM